MPGAKRPKRGIQRFHVSYRTEANLDGENRVTEDEIRSIYRETIDALYGYVSRRCGGDSAQAEDVTQETWMRAIRSWPQVGIPDRPLAWLMTVARNLMLNERRRVPPLPLESVDLNDIVAAAVGVQDSDAMEKAAAVTSALQRLPARQRRLIEAFHFERCSTSHLARAQNLSERAIEGRLRRARRNLRRELEAALSAEGGVQ